VRIACIGGGPAGLYLGILVRLASPRHHVTVYERNRPDDTFGFGVVFSDATLGHLAAADPVSYEAIAAGFARWDDIEVHVGGQILRSTGHGFAGIERRRLLEILQRRAAELGVDVRHDHEVRSLDEVAAADVVVAADGVASWVRTTLAAELGPSIDLRPNKFVWLGTTVPYRAFTFLFKQTRHGLFRVHAYRYAEAGSTFIVECTPETWARAELDDADEDDTIARLEAIFADELAGHRLIKNRSIWRNFPTVRNKTWRHRNVVLVGDAAHTAHFSIGSGTKLAMEDCIALRDALVAEPDVEAALATYEMKRRPEVEALQAAAQASLEWFEGTERYLAMPPVQLTYSLLTRSLRVSHASVLRRDPPLARAVEQLIARSAGIDADPPPPPMFVPVTLAGLRCANRIALAPWRLGAADAGVVGDPHLVFLGGRAAGGVGLVMTETIAAAAGGDGAPAGTPRLGDDDQTVAWRRVVEFVRAGPARIGAQLAAFPGGDPVADLGEAARRAGFAGFDLLVVHLGAGALATARVDAIVDVVARVRDAWPADRPLGVRTVDPGFAAGRDAVVTLVDALRGRGVGVAWVAASVDAVGAPPSRGSVAPLADWIRNETGVATVLEGVAAVPADIDALIAAGRCDACALDRPLVVDPGFVHRAAEAVGWTPS
jgi:anthraniloyl-CoA monooxygenase